jgi:ammonia channel protein AmtB
MVAPAAWIQRIIQAESMACTIVYSAIGTLTHRKVADVIAGLRMS